MNAPVHHRAMLVSLTQRAWKATATDNKLASLTEDSVEAQHGTMRVVKELTPRQYMQPIKLTMNVGRAEHYKMTVPGFVRGQHLLASELFERYCEVQSLVRKEFMEHVDRFVEYYPRILEMAPKRLGRAFNQADFPSPYQIKSYFDYDLKFAPIPEAHDWRLDGLSNTDTEALRNEVENDVRRMYNEATEEVYGRAREILEKIAHQAETYTGGPGSATLRDATIENLQEISELVCAMNVTNDPVLDQVGKEMVAHFGTVVPSELRKSEQMRKDIAEAAKGILKRMPKINR